LSLLLACVLACSLAPRALDLDGDGAWADDCDDADETTYPDAPELCDGVNNDCDGVTDEDACGAMTSSDARFAVGGEDGVGPGVVTGHLDGDAFGDTLLQAQFGDSPAVCIIPGARLVDGVAGGPGATPPLTNVASCWISDGTLLGLAVTSAAPFGRPGTDVAWVLSQDDGLCAVDPFGAGITLEAAAYGCSDLDGWVAADGESRLVLQLATAAPETATLMARTTDGIGVAAIAELIDGPEAGWALAAEQFLVGMAGGEDVDGDGVADIVAADASDTFILSSELGLSVPIEVAGAHYPRGSGEAMITGVVLPGDLDGDGLADWSLLTSVGLDLYSGSTWYTTVPEVLDAAACGDFNGDGGADLAVTTMDGGAEVHLGPLASVGSLRAQVHIDGDGGTFAASLAAVDVDADGMFDLWITDPGATEAGDTGFDSVSAGTAYLFGGFAIDP